MTEAESTFTRYGNSYLYSAVDTVAQFALGSFTSTVVLLLATVQQITITSALCTDIKQLIKVLSSFTCQMYAGRMFTTVAPF